MNIGFKLNMKIALLILIISISVLALSPDDLGKRFILKRTSTEIIIDGVIDSAWSLADSTSDFFQLFPFQKSGSKVPEPSLGSVWYRFVKRQRR